MTFISNKDFNAAIKLKKEDNGSALQWRELPIGEILLVKVRKLLHYKEDTCMILTLSSKVGDIYVSWATKQLSDELIRNYANDDNVYVRSNGLKPLKTDPTRSYYDYDIIKA